MKLCECGCGKPAAIATKTRIERGHVKGQPQRFYLGHNPNTGKRESAEARRARLTAGQTPNPCGCGCGQMAPLHAYTGKPCRYVSGHSGRTVRRGYVQARQGDGWRLEHVLIAERALGKPLPAGAPVHHVDGNRRNNANRNLVICQDHRYHMLLHHRARVIAAGGNPNTHTLCTLCKALKPLEAFNRISSNTSTGRQSACRECQSLAFKAWRAAKAEAAKKEKAA